MAVNDRNRLLDGYTSMEAGIDSGLPPSLIDRNSLAWAVNTVFRSGWPEARPGFINREFDFGGSETLRSGLEDGYFQGAGTYKTDNGRAYIAASVSGRIFTIDITNGFTVQEITIPSDANQVTQPHAWFQQAESWLVVQNNLNAPFLYNGAGSRRAGPNEVPVGGPMAYGKGRLWVARESRYWGGDIVYGDPVYGRDSVIRFTENDFLAEGGAFGVPDGPITGLAFAANLDTSLGDGDLLVGTPTDIHANNAPIDRDVWKYLESPLQRYAARAFGSVNHESMVVVNGDVVYRSADGIRSLQYSRRDFESWGQTPISRQVHRALQFDTEAWLTEASAVNFDNRLLMTIQPQLNSDHGVWHRGLASLDYHRVSGMGAKWPPAWEGVWTGLRILRILTIEVDTEQRCFIFALNDDNQIQLWEVSKKAAFDRNDIDNVPIEWIVETRGFTCEQPARWKRLMGAVQWLDRILGTVSMQAFYRVDEGECWHVWDRWADCVEYRNCEASEACPTYPYSDVQPIKYHRSQFRSYIGFTQPQDVAEPQTGGLTRDGFEFQLRFECSGRFRLKRFALITDDMPMPLWGDTRKITCPTTETGSCATTDCPSVQCCDRDDYGYIVESGDDPLPEYPTYPVAPEYPAEPEYPGGGGDDGGGGGDDGGGDDGGGDGGGDDGGGDGVDNPVYDALAPSDPPELTAPCTGTLIYVESSYVWGLLSGQDPNALLTQEQIDCHSALFDIEVSGAVQAYEDLGYTVTIVSGKKWVYSGYVGVLLAMVNKSTCDPNDGIGDHYVSFSGYTSLQQVLCVV